MSIRPRVHDRETIFVAVHRFKELLKGRKKGSRKNEYFESPGELLRRVEYRKQRAIRKATGQPT